MLTFKVVKEEYGWAVRLGRGMATPFWTQAAAIREAHQLCERMRGHGLAAEVVIEEEEGVQAPPSSAATAPGRRGEPNGWT